MPDVPTVAEMGLPGYEGILWIGLIAPAGTPQAVLDKLHASAARAVKAPELLERFKREGVDAVGGTPEAFVAQIKREIPQWRDVAASSNIKIE
jgi:tripartite-type tricarboxylate transporter receptor subunit TctC